MPKRRPNRLFTVKPISPRLHSLIDYGFAAGNLLLPSVLGTSGRARALFASFGLAQGTLNALTVQPFAVDQVVPFRIHGRLEKSSAPIYFGVPVLLGLHREPKARSPLARRRRRTRRRLQPDRLGRSPHRAMRTRRRGLALSANLGHSGHSGPPFRPA